MSELLDKQVNAQKESLKNTSRVHASSHKQMKRCATKMKETNKKKRCACKNVIHERKPFVMPILKTGENNLHEFWLNDSRYNEIGAQ